MKKVHTADDFRVGQTVLVAADQGVRKGEVTGRGRTRITVRHPRNQRGDMAERPYPMNRIVVGQKLTSDSTYSLVFADGYVSSQGRATPYPNIHTIPQEA